MNILGGPGILPDFFDSKGETKEAEVKNAAMINEGHETDDGTKRRNNSSLDIAAARVSTASAHRTSDEWA
jgi:hypothetical protein